MKITIDRALLEQALEALELANVNHWWGSASIEKAITAFRAALAQEQAEPVQEPVALVRTWHKGERQHAELLDWGIGVDALSDGEHTLYTAPPKAEPLTEELVTWGVDWGRDGDQSCVSIIKKHADGTIEVVAVEYAPAQPPADPVQEPDSPERRCGGPGCDLKCCQPVQEPYCYIYEYDGVFGLHREFYPRPYNGMKPTRTVPVYTAPPKAEPLTDEEIDAMWRNAASEEGFTTAQFVRAFVRAVERALEKKNGR